MSWSSFFVKLFHPSVSSSIHGWHHSGKKTLAEINNSAHVSLFKKGMHGPGGGHPQDFDISISSSISCSSGIWGIFVVSGLLPWSAVCCYLTGHKQCKHQDFQRPGSRWIHAECGIQRGFGNVVCSCNFVICTVKYTHTPVHQARGSN
jgi:hypothetical protein